MGYLGVKLNQNKSKLICSDPTTRGIVLSAFPGLQVVNIDDATLLGFPLGGGHEWVSKHIGEKVNVLKLMGDRMEHIHSHDALVLLCHSFAIPKMLHIALFIFISRRL